ncbi:unnamed protein product [Adineta steineri]|uniref:CCHC-type domain-containing protein n=1 Tax=Adineta steineri TaxID=433720 RepID=A0A816BGE8_9BILA|nr:unnamed protein product [Adineta steineri]CAF1609601.1 unnamed protein product [Adineta steineri]
MSSNIKSCPFPNPIGEERCGKQINWAELEEHLMKPPHRMIQKTAVEMANYARKVSPKPSTRATTTTSKKPSFNITNLINVHDSSNATVSPIVTSGAATATKHGHITRECPHNNNSRSGRRDEFRGGQDSYGDDSYGGRSGSYGGSGRGREYGGGSSYGRSANDFYLSNQSDRFRRNYSSYNNPMICYNCNQSGHISRNCIKPRSNNFGGGRGFQSDPITSECPEYIYNKPSKPWSLQNAILYAANSLLDKTQTENNWFSMLDPKYTTLTPAKLENMINYAAYDCINLAYLQLPVAQR